MLAAREEVFREHGIDSVERLRALRATGPSCRELASTDIVLLVDGFGALRDDFDELDDAVGDLLKRGGGYGIHVVAAMLRWNDVRDRRPGHLRHPARAAAERPRRLRHRPQLAETLTAEVAGRVLTDGKLFAQVALGRLDGARSTADLGSALEQAARSVAAAWPGERAQPVRVLPSRVRAAPLPTPAASPRHVPIGLDQTALAPVPLDLFERDQHLLILGDNECGKTNLLQADRPRPRRALLRPGRWSSASWTRGAACATWCRSRTTAATRTTPASARGSRPASPAELAKRMPDESAEAGRLPAPGTWSGGPRIVILVDDYDILTTAGQQPLNPFLPYIPPRPTSACTSWSPAGSPVPPARCTSRS